MSKPANTAFDIIKAEIARGRFRSGERLRESELTELCGVSRTPVREALRRLANEGLVTLTPNVGAHVAVLDNNDLADLYEMRVMVESYAASRAAVRITPDQIAALKANADAMDKACTLPGADSAEPFARANAAFHRIILTAADNSRLEQIAQIVVEAPLALRTLIRYTKSEMKRSCDHHRELIAAFESHNPDWARSVMSSHLLAAFDVLSRDAKRVAKPQP